MKKLTDQKTEEIKGMQTVLYGAMVDLTEIIDTSDHRIQKLAARHLRWRFERRLNKLSKI